METYNQTNRMMRARMLANLPDDDKLDIVAQLINEIQLPFLSQKMMNIGNLACQKADEMERING